MDDASVALLIMSGLVLIIFIGFLVWGIKSKQFKNIEEAKYQLFKKSEKEEPSPEKVRSQEEDKS